MINLLFFSSDYKIGVSNSLFGQANAINQHPEANLLCVGGEKEQEAGIGKRYEEHQIKLVRIHGLDNHARFLKLVHELNQIISEFKPSFVHVHNNWQLALVSYLKYISGFKFKIIYSIHGYRHNNRFKAFFAKRIIDFALFLFADIVFAGSSELKNKFPLIRKKCFLLVQGVEPIIFTIQQPPVIQPVKEIVFAGQFRKGKNQKLIIEAFHKYVQSANDLNFKVYLPGEGYLRKNCMEYANQCGLGNVISFPGQLTREEIKLLYSKCQISIIPSNSETFGYCIAEPFVAGNCIFTRNIGIASDIIRHGDNGFIFEDAKDLAKLLIQYLQDDKIITIFSNRTFAERNYFDWINITHQYFSLIKTKF